VVQALDLPAAGGLQPDPGRGEGLGHAGGQVGADAAAEGGGDLVGEFGEAAGLAAARVPLAQQLGEQPAVDVGPPGQARVVHLGGDQEGGGLGGRQQPHPVGVGGGGVAPGLVGVDREEGVQGERGGLRVEQRGLRAGLGGTLRRIGGYGCPLEPRPGGGRRAGLAGAALVAEEQQLGGFDVVAPLDPDPGGEQAGVHGRGGPPHPADAGGRGADR
jgi:hypothetical protein